MTTGTDPATAGHTTTYYVVDKNRDYAQVLAEWTASWTGQTAPDPEDDDLAVTYRYGHNLIHQTRYPGGTPTTHYFHYDGQMSTQHLTDAGGSPTDSYTYGAYGDLLASTGSTTNSYRYTGEQLDPDLGAANTPGNPDGSAGSYYLRARYYNPAAGRFLTRDPFEGVQNDPLSLHKYLYCGSGPVGRADPSGHSFVQTVAVTAMRLYLCALPALQIAAANTVMTTFMVIIPFINDTEVVVFGKDGASPQERAVVAAFMAFDVLPGGHIVRRVFPTRNLRKLARWLKILKEEHRQDAHATKQALRSALQFSENIVEDSVTVGGKGKAGADIAARTVGGQAIAREFAVFQGGMKSFWGKIMDEARQAGRTGPDIRHVFIHVTDDVLSNPNAGQEIRQTARGPLKNGTQEKRAWCCRCSSLTAAGVSCIPRNGDGPLSRFAHVKNGPYPLL